MANYPKFSSVFVPRTVADLHRELITWANELARELDSQDTFLESLPSTKIYTVTTATDVKGPLDGFVSYSTSSTKYRGYVSGTGWVDFN